MSDAVKPSIRMDPITKTPSPTQMAVDVAPSPTQTKYIVLSDMHTTLARLPLVLQIMRHTHKLAVESGATVVFAGDWQVAGFAPY